VYRSAARANGSNCSKTERMVVRSGGGQKRLGSPPGAATREVFVSRTTTNRLAQKIGSFMMVIIEESQK
jgi:hypothetical protein